ncbi:phospholipase D-like domain-containing protein [Mycoplasmoides alvi]|uniref:phospholipase D-like domain-containing protein n=1 Tax=Mycoplasmoides alvi TaxID=78580 RepID=UPI000A8541A7|nr:phospholipase D-like domain-containing protein [Mycoplasmoides alvi]
MSIGFAFCIFNSKKRIINVRLCWILVIFCIPIVGLFIFLIFGLNPLLRMDKKTYMQNQKEWVHYESFEFTEKFLKDDTINSYYQNLFNYAYSLEKRPIYENNKIEIIDSTKLYSESIRLIREAKKFIHIQYYIISDGIWLRSIANELIKQAKKGIKVRFIYDWVGSYRRKHEKIIEQMREVGIIVGIFNPKKFTKYTARTNFRCHRKCLIVDNEKALYGGSNIGDEYICYSPDFIHWYDNNIILSGECVKTLNLIFSLDLTVNCFIPAWQKDMDDLEDNKKFYLDTKIDVNKFNNKTIAQVFERTASYADFNMTTMLISAFANAKKRIWISTPYYIPGDSITDLLKFAALSGIDVRLIVPGYPDDKKYILTINRSHYKSLLQTGIKIYEYNGFDHAKMILIDDELTISTTSNLDFRSLIINYESGILIKDKKVAEKFQEEMMKLFYSSNLVNENMLTKHEWNWIRFKMLFINIYHPLL